MYFKKYDKILKFGVSGVAAATTEYGLFIILSLMRSYDNPTWLLAAQAISFSAGLVVSFALNKVWVFSAQGKTGSMFGKYLLLAGVNLLLSSLVIVALGVIMPALIAKIIVMIMIASWNYLIFSRFIFR